MQKLTLIVFAVLCTAVVLVHGGGGKGKGGKGGMMGKMKKCGDEDLNTEEAYKGMKECKEEMKAAKAGGDGEERRRRDADEDEGGKKKGKGKGRRGKGNRMKMMVCAWKKQGVLDASGKWNEAGAIELCNKVYPASKSAAAVEKMKACAAENSSKFSEDDNYAGYKDFKKCMMKGHFEICGGGFGGKGGKDKGKKNSEEED